MNLCVCVCVCVKDAIDRSIVYRYRTKVINTTPSKQEREACKISFALAEPTLPGLHYDEKGGSRVFIASRRGLSCRVV